MTLRIGARLGPYEIESPLGAGGMGEVYRGRDTRLDRPVAIKVLARDLADSAELRERFEREARLIANLNHPHICVVYDVGRQDDFTYLVMELLEGETLAARLARGPLHLREATSIALQIGSALARAHQVGVVHRDVKPGNVMLTRSGAKLLDFGLAKPAGVTGGLAGPTESVPITGEGTILGTLQYMAPEQLEGRPADARSDIFAFGAVLYEMITGKRAFEGTTPVSVISAILRDHPRPVAELQPFVPPALDAIVRTCLEKDPDERWHSAHDLASQLRWIQQSGSQPAVPLQRWGRSRRQKLAWIVAIVFALTSLGLGVPYLRSDRPPDVMEFSIVEPADVRFNPRNLVAPTPAISPDGRHLVFTGLAAGHGVLVLRSLDSVDTRVLPGTDGSMLPFWSADSRTVGFFADGVLKKTAIASGGIEIICKVEGGFEGATWNKDNVVLFSKGEGGLWRVDGNGGEPVAVTTPDASRREMYHLWPVFLPDGEHFLYFVQPGNSIFYGSLDGSAPKRLLTADAKAIYSPPGYLLFAREGALFAQRFDARRGQLTGDPLRVVPSVRAIRTNGRAAYAVSETGALVYRAGDATMIAEIRWVDRISKRRETILEAGDYRDLALSPDSRHLAYHRHDEPGGGGIWVKDLVRGTITRLTSHNSHNFDPTWSPDGTRVAFASNRNGHSDLYVRAASGTGEDQVLTKGNDRKYGASWSSDHRFIVYQLIVAENQSDLWVLPVNGGAPQPYIQSSFNEIQPAFSPDARWIAYTSNETGRYEVYVQPYPADGSRFLVSSAGGTEPCWRGDGRELYYIAPSGTLMAVSVKTSGRTFEPGVPETVFQMDTAVNLDGSVYQPSVDGQRFVVAERPVTASTGKVEPLTMVLNWTSGLQRSR